MSGLNQRFTKPSCLNWHREFESRSLRKCIDKYRFNDRVSHGIGKRVFRNLQENTQQGRKRLLER